MKNLLYSLIVLLFISGSVVAGPGPDVASVDAATQAAFDELDKVITEQDAKDAIKERETLLDQQNRFQQFVADELFNLEFDLRDAGKDSIQAAGIVSVVDKYASSLVDGPMSNNPKAMTGAFQDMVVTLRRRMRLPVSSELLGVFPDQAPVVPQAPPPPVVQVPPAAVVPSVPPPPPSAPVVTAKDVVEDIFTAIEAANWTKNIDHVIKDWPKLADQSWQSPDRKVTFAVGVSAPTVNMSLGRLRAESNARVVLARRDQAPDELIDVELRGTQPIRYKTSRDGTIYCLIAVPTSLLSR